MTRSPVNIEAFSVKPFHLWDVQWLLLSAGDFHTGQYNAMTVGWGSIGYIWRRPFIQVVVRPVRYTYRFMEENETFTVCAFPEQYHAALQLLGRRSGRDGDKINASGLTPIASTLVPAPSYSQASLVFECRKIYWADIDPSHFLDPGIDQNYPNKDYHRAYFGEILAIFAQD